ncbi:MAG TPA: alpha/beta fold hydrolase [Steroidobacteraceae bacterium]|jgi:pimeloyl-ACP methyl ester carboxylesterase|nr:alpha/beta fold hydrolase [Steroidobacteraceae bacterium]
MNVSVNIRLADVDICLDDTGSGIPVLLLHGFPSTRQLWGQVTPALVKHGYRAIVPDLVGYGSSPAPAGLRIDMASQARWMWQLLDVLAVERVILVAHDVGSAAAQLMVTSAPGRVRGLAVLDGVHADEWAMDAIDSIRNWPPAAAHRLVAVLQRRLGRSDRMRGLIDAYAGVDGGAQLIRAARDLDPGQTADIGESLRASRVAAVVLWGRDDRYLAVDTVARPLADLLDAPLVLLPGGHFTPVDCPAEVSAALCSFFATLV